MIAIQYPTLPQGVDYEGIMGATTRGYNAGKDWRDEKNANAAFGQYINGVGGQQQPQQTLSSLGNMFGGQPQQNTVQRAPLPDVMDPATARVDQAFAAQGQGGMPSVGEMRQYIAKAAQTRGIDPGIAIRVAQAEGLAPNTWQSNVTKNGVREPSYGPFQMLVGGSDTGFPEGLGNAFAQQTGLDPSNPANWQKMTDFALDTAAKQGWGQWYGAKAAGIDNMQGINGAGLPAGQPAQAADASGSVMPQGAPRAAPQAQQPASILPPPEVMQALFKAPGTRPLAIALAQSAIKLRANANDPQAQIEYQIAVEKLRQLRDPQSKLINAGGGSIYNPNTGEWITQPGGGTTAETGLVPQMMRNPKTGETIYVQPTKDGRLLKSQVPEGFQPYDPYSKSYQTNLGKAQAGNAATLPSDLQTADQTVTQINELLDSKGLDSIVGPADQFRPSWTLGDSGRDALARFNQLKGKAFLQAFGMLKGGGQITEVEGQKAQDAMARMDRAQGEKEFRQALTDFRDAVVEGKRKLREKAGQPADQDGNRTSSGVQWSIEE